MLYYNTVTPAPIPIPTWDDQISGTERVGIFPESSVGGKTYMAWEGVEEGFSAGEWGKQGKNLAGKKEDYGERQGCSSFPYLPWDTFSSK